MTDEGTVGVRFRCECMTEEVEVRVPKRKVSTDVVYWLEEIAMPKVFADHRKRSPRCRETSLDELKIPAPKDGVIGSGDAEVDA